MSEEKPQDPKILVDTRWAGFLEEMRQWPPDSAEWEVYQLFADQVRILGGSKCQERTATGQLKEVLGKLREDFGETLTYFGRPDTNNWQAALCPLQEIPERTGIVEDLLQKLGEFQLTDRQVANNLQEARQHRTKIEALENQISSAIERLDRYFQGPTDEGEEDDHPPEPSRASPSDKAPASESEQETQEDRSVSDEVVDEPPPSSTQPPSTQSQAPTASLPRVPESRHEESIPVVEGRATSSKTIPQEEQWESLGWTLLAEGDWAGAYWLFRSLSAQGQPLPIKPELLAVLQGSYWLDGDTDERVFDIRQCVAECSPGESNPERLLQLAAALRPTLIAPHSGLVSWLPQRNEIDPPALGALAEAIRTFAKLGHPLRREDIGEIEGTAGGSVTSEEITKQAEVFLKKNQARKLKIRRATSVLHNLLDRSGALGQLLDPVVHRKTTQVEVVRSRMRDLRDRKQIVDLIHQVDQRLLTLRGKPITADPLEQLVRTVQEAMAVADRWCRQVESESASPTSAGWLSGHVEDLRDTVVSVLPELTKALGQMQGEDQPLHVTAPSTALQRMIAQLQGTLGLGPEESLAALDVWQRDSSSLAEAMNRRLLWLPEVGLDDNGCPAEGQETQIAEALRFARDDKRSLQEAGIRRLEGQDFRFSSTLLAGLEDDDVGRDWERRTDEQLKDAKAGLGTAVSEIENGIEQGVVDGVLLEEDRARLGGELESIGVEEPLYFTPLFEKLDGLKREIEEKYDERLENLSAQWRDVQASLKRSIHSDQLESVEGIIERAMDQRDTRVVEESLARLRDMLREGSEWKSEWFSPSGERRVLEEFLKACPSLEDRLGRLGSLRELAKAVKRDGSWEGMNFGEEDAKALESWHELKRQVQPSEVRGHVHALCKYLGFYLRDGESAVHCKKSERDWIYCQVVGSASETLVRPIHQLGSEASAPYDLVCMRKWLGVGQTRVLLRELHLDGKLVIIFFLGRLTERQRRDLGGGEQRLVLDETMLVFLSGERSSGERGPLSWFLQCSLPFAGLNPYAPFRAGRVPPEIYYGRNDLADQLQNENTCIVFGGRQLGKSALLRQVEHEFHEPEGQRYAFFEDIKLVGDPITGELAASLWIRLRDAFKGHGLITRNVKSVQPKTIQRHIQEAMDKSPQLRVLVLFDEADHFLHADAKSSFQVVEGLRTLMQDTGFRFKVVFAGLHDVQRFKNIANQPLAHFGENLLVGPLDPGSARQLVREPLEALGYRFRDETTILKVLSYTNYHPGLIQYFCRELLSQLQHEVKRRPAGPPYPVRSRDVESVYRSAQVREVIRERLDWTLALDRRYQCISWAMIFEQKETSDSYGRSFSVSELIQLAQYWWQQGFVGTDMEALRGLLGEMVGLGILVRTANGRYMLRSPNLVRLMGSTADIESRLLELTEKAPPAESEPSSQHRLLDPQSRRYSPLTLVQEGRMQQGAPSGVSLVFGSAALGASMLNRALSGIADRGDSDGGGSRGDAIPRQSMTPSRVRQWLESYFRRQRGSDQLLAYGWLKGNAERMAECVREVLRMCGDFDRNRRKPVRIVFVLDPRAAYSWLELPEEGRSELEDGVDLVYLRRWDEIGIQQRLHQAGKVDSPEVCEQVVAATGGWPVLIDELLERCGRSDNPTGFTEGLTEEVRSESELKSRFLQETGVDVQKSAAAVFRTLAVSGEVSEGELDTLGELVDEDSPIDSAVSRLAVELFFRLGCVEKKSGKYSVESVLGGVVGSA